MSDSLWPHGLYAACQDSLYITISQSLLKLMSIESVMPSNHLILCHLLLFPPSIFPSIRVFSSELVLRIRGPKYWNFSFSISPSNEESGLVSFRIDWFDLLVVQGTLKSLLQHHSSKASVFWCSALFMVQLSHPYMTTGKIIALTIQTFVGKVMSLFFNILSMLVIAFLPRNKRLLISRLQSSSAVILEAKKIKSVTVSPCIYHEVMGPDAMILAFWTLSLHQLFHSPLSPSSRGSLVPLWIQYNSNRNSPWLWRNSGSSLYMFIHTMSFIVYERAKDKNRQNTPKEEPYERTCLPDIKIILGLR